MLCWLGTEAGRARGAGGHGTVLTTATATAAAPSCSPAAVAPLTHRAVVAAAGPGLARRGGAGRGPAARPRVLAWGAVPAARYLTLITTVVRLVDLTRKLQDHVEGLPPLVPHQTDRGLVHHLVEDHQVVVLQLTVGN